MKHDQRSSALQDTEWVLARGADKRSPVLLESWQRCTFGHPRTMQAEIFPGLHKPCWSTAESVTTCCARARLFLWAVSRFACQVSGNNRGAQTIQATSPLQISLSVKRSWSVSPDQSVMSSHVWLVSHCSEPATLGGVFPNTDFSHIKSIFASHGMPEERWLFIKAAALSTSLGNLPVHRAYWASNEDYEGLSSTNW